MMIIKLPCLAHFLLRSLSKFFMSACSVGTLESCFGMICAPFAIAVSLANGCHFSYAARDILDVFKNYGIIEQ